ncbi:hypothetical protein [Chromobacterium phragmitis]|uniref:Uncharacterized protein n=1 Tax=Chromobacterium phragmitis TaxID=2202141 RepID=A0A344UDZ5_9NEIS|nr:hypothetical protein [Chromobacterium phragmitis]AXE33493.1 hypothetical protein DK843_03675 [Chromobacterium phragmitis]AXE34289.1 hypothetical protein DK843_08270 [Chromobacterium phragmitis]
MLKRKAIPLSLLAIIAIIISGVITMNINDEEKSPKTKDHILDKDGLITKYDSFISERMNKKKLTPIDKTQLESFLKLNLDILSGLITPEEVDRTNINVDVKLWAPKLLTAPIISATMTNTYIIKEPTSSTKGVYGEFSSSILRKDDKAPWEYSSLSMLNLYKFPILTDFEPTDYAKLNLKLVDKFLLSNLENQAQRIDFSPTSNYKEFASSNRNGLNYAFYKFISTKSAVPLTVVFGVQEDQYNEHEIYPKNWYYVYMKRGS